MRTWSKRSAPVRRYDRTFRTTLEHCPRPLGQRPGVVAATRLKTQDCEPNGEWTIEAETIGLLRRSVDPTLISRLSRNAMSDTLSFSSIPWIEAHMRLNRTPKKRPDRERAREARMSTTSTRRRSREKRSACGPKCRVQRNLCPDRERAKRV